MEQTPAAKKTSPLRMIFYVLLGLILLTVFLEFSGMADVAGKRETETIIDRPHDR